MSNDDDYCYFIKAPFPDEDNWVYVLIEAGLNEGKLLSFKTYEDAQSWLNAHEMKNCVIEKIKE